jgi:RNA recognition motif-containing protein
VSKTLRIGNLPTSATEDELRSKFARFGTVESATLMTDSRTGRSKRFGFIEMATDLEARTAITRLNMTQYDDMTMSVCEARVDN